MDLSQVEVEKPLVLYHGPGCRDGFCAAYLAHLRFGEGTELVPQDYGDPAAFEGSVLHLRVRGEAKTFDLAGRDVLMLDWTPSNAKDPGFTATVLEGVQRRARSLYVIDHHEKAGPALLSFGAGNGLSRVAFDIARSGCGIALDEFFPGVREKAVEWLASYGKKALLDESRIGSLETKDRDETISSFHVNLALVCEAWDLWKHDRYEQVKEVCAFVDTVERSVEAWGSLPPRIGVLAERGAAVLAYQRQQVERIVRHAQVVSWPFGSGVQVTAVNSPVLQSEVGEALYEASPDRASLVWYRNERGETVCSLRSKKGSGPNVSEMASKFGGGGHANASGFRLQPHEHENAAWLWFAADRAETPA